MAVAYTTHNRMLTVALSGDIDHHRVKGLVQDLEREIDEVLPRQLIVDCAGITFMDSSGIGLIIGRYKLMARRGGSVAVICPDGKIDRIFQMAGLYQIIERLA